MKNPFELFRKKRFLPSLLLFTLPFLHCVTVPDFIDQKSDEDASDLKSIRENYPGYDCFSANFNLAVAAPGRNEKGRAVLRADRKHSRMLLTIRDAVFGIEVLRVVFIGDTVHIWNLRDGKSFRIPLDSFEVRGLGNNSIRLPFSLFQNFLFATLPDDLYSRGRVVSRDGGNLDVSIDGYRDTYTYHFESNRLRQLIYRDPSGQRVDVALSGNYGETAFPETIRIEAGIEENERYLASEKMDIRFRKIDATASCEDALFSVKR